MMLSKRKILALASGPVRQRWGGGNLGPLREVFWRLVR